MRLKIGLLALLLLPFAAAHAQNWGGGVDDERVHFGFTFQYTASSYKVTKKPNWREPYVSSDGMTPLTDPLTAIYGKSSPGFGIGFVVNGRISNHFDLRLTPTLVFTDRLMEYEYLTPTVTNPADFTNPLEKKVVATMVEFPLGIKIKSDRRNNFRAYMLYGVKYSIDIASKKKSDDSILEEQYKFLKNQKSYFSAEAAFGMDLYFEYFKMSPEIKLSYSLNDVLDRKERNPFNNPIDKLMLRHVTFSLFFE
ncbi:outer membrane beta-barrel protein [Pedobacter sp. PAMC26386]|nr:outer membrane beta-barrel protein [Pedobacter sp. PAMC26386]